MTAVLLSSQAFAQTTSTAGAQATSTTKEKTKAKKKKKAVPGATSTEAQATTATTPVTSQAPEVKPEEKKEQAPVAAAAAQLSTAEKTLQYMKEHFSASYHGEYYFQRRMDLYLSGGPVTDKDIQDIKYMHNPTVVYKPTKDWQVMTTAEFKYTDAPAAVAGSFVNDYYRALVTVTRKNILTEKDHGIQLDAGIGRRDFNTRVAKASYGNDRAFTTISKTFGKNNGSLFVQYLFNDPRTIAATQWKHGLELIPTINLQLTDKLSYLFNDDIVINSSYVDTNPRDFYISHEMNLGYVNYQWTDKISTYYQLKYYHTEDFTNAFQSKDDFMEHYAGIGYAVTPKITVTAEVGNEIIHAHDKRDFFGSKAKYPEFALYLDAAL
jgi:hypothetical protein